MSTEAGAFHYGAIRQLRTRLGGRLRVDGVFGSATEAATRLAAALGECPGGGDGASARLAHPASATGDDAPAHA